LVERVGAENIVIVQLTREGHDYSTDSRRYFNGRLRKTFTINESTEIESQYVLPEELNILTYRIHNNGSIRNFHDVLNNIFEELSEQYVIEETRGNTDSQCDKSS